MSELDYTESWAPKNWCFWTVVLEKTLKSLLDCKEIQLVNLKGNQSWMFIERTDAELKLQYFGHLMWRTDSLEKNQVLGKTEGRGEGDEDRGWDDWMVSLTRWTLVCVGFWSWWWTGKPDVVQSMGSWLSDWTNQRRQHQKDIAMVYVNDYSIFCCRSFIVSSVTFMSLIHFSFCVV